MSNFQGGNSRVAIPVRGYIFATGAEYTFEIACEYPNTALGGLGVPVAAS